MPIAQDRPADEDDPRTRLLAFHTLLDGSKEAAEKHVDLSQLRRLCSRGIPDHPPHLRPLAYTLLFEILPSEKSLWKPALLKRKGAYHATSSSRFDPLLSNISRDTEKLKSSFWQRFTRPRRSSPFRALSQEDIAQDVDSPASKSQHSLDEDSDSDEEELSKPILSRRAIFKRLDVHNTAKHRGWPKKAPSDLDEDLSSPSPSDSGMLSPKITLSTEAPSSILSRLDTVRPPPLDTHALQEPADATSSPILLLSPKPLLLSSATGEFPSPMSGALFRPETHLEALIRLLYVFCLANPQWQYRSSLIDIAAYLYLIFAGGIAYSLRDAEEQVYWMLAAMFKDINTILNETGVDIVLLKYEKRLRWFNTSLYSILQENNIVPTLYGYRWFTAMFTNDISLSSLTLLWDCIMSEELSNESRQPKVDLLIDIAVAMVLLVKGYLLNRSTVKRRTLRTTSLWDEVEDDLERPEESKDELFLRSINLLRHYPLQKVGGIHVLAVEAHALKDARLTAVSEGNDPDYHVLPTVQAAIPANQQASNHASWGKALGSLWSAVTSATASKMTIASSGPVTSQRNLVLVAEHATSNRCARSNSNTSVTSNGISSIQERLAYLASNFHGLASPDPTTPHTPSLPRPLLLSSLPRRESFPKSRRGSSSSSRKECSPDLGSSPRKTPPVESQLSPLLARGSPPRGESGGLHLLGNRHRSSLGVESSWGEDIHRRLEFEDTTSTNEVLKTIWDHLSVEE
ncbi:hypothetical protein IAT38_004754 [Cryptococcus sp. DSM 104549]